MRKFNFYDERFENDVEFYENYESIIYDPVSDDYVRAYPIENIENEPMSEYIGCKRSKKDGFGGYCEHCPNLNKCL